ncbi:cytochrome aa3 quinol oxidase subunit II [Fervidibacillus halotolerans]|uniref:Quinol oxidase subunit 2 n=1 Tax=Fervidibacillus halotolerans TaxID=2980027 RepID=A0A9E8M0T5_9BACI|nr:cytochrome aa3 quinol oxidase subunit II [Fervidibacillus halotolerans]WAA12491.1 cytochrome aa3 quinol oxidase subunit II [Fervidibacillus halotolerans]
MRKRLFGSTIALFLLLLLSGCETNLVVFQPQGPQAQKITDLINWSLIWIGLIVFVVIAMFVYFVWKYRAGANSEYDPEEHGNKWVEITWTTIPIIIVILLIIPTVRTLYDLEEIPEGYEDQDPLIIHVTSADWKWIFSYPEQNIETINYVNIPVKRPVVFKLTSAGTMQSFWIPSLSGQKYTMAKMEVELPIVAEHEGSYFGRNTNFNGEGFRDMEFEVLVQSPVDFDEWVQEVQEKAPKLTEEEYTEILKPSHLGRLTFSNTHLEWINHADHHAKEYLYPDLYHEHGYPGKIFYKQNNTDNAVDETGGDHNHGH